MITVLEYLVIAAAIGLVIFFLAAWVFGRGEQMAPLPARTSPAELPDQSPAGDDIRNVRFAVGVRGYRMGDVDWTLDRLADELDRLRGQIRELGGDPDRVPAAPELLPDNDELRGDRDLVGAALPVGVGHDDDATQQLDRAPQPSTTPLLDTSPQLGQTPLPDKTPHQDEQQPPVVDK